MSEQQGLTHNWPIDMTAPAQEHRNVLRHVGERLLNERFNFPADGRVGNAYTYLAIGGSVLFQADPGTGKSAAALAIVGEESAIPMQKDSNRQDVFGYINPITGEFSEPLMSRIRDNGHGAMFAALFDELPDVKNPGFLHQLWTFKQLILANGEVVDLKDFTKVATGNFADGNRVGELDDAMKSRWGMSILLGDMTQYDYAEGVHNPDLANAFPILPPKQVRGILKEHISYHFGNQPSTELKNYHAGLVKNLVMSQVIQVPSLMNWNDHRKGEALHQATAAMMFRDYNDSGNINAHDAAKAAPLIYPTFYSLSPEGRARLQRTHREKGLPNVDDQVLAIATNRVVAKYAIRTALGLSNDETASRDQQRVIDNHVKDFSFANFDNDYYDIDEAMSRPSKDRTVKAVNADQAKAKAARPNRRLGINLQVKLGDDKDSNKKS